jgi:hypothetical protein
MSKRSSTVKHFVVAVMGLSLVFGQSALASAESYAPHRTKQSGRAAAYGPHFARRPAPIYGYAAPSNLPAGAMVMPGYVFVPGRGILGEACNLPTSACPNTERDIQ